MSLDGKIDSTKDQVAGKAKEAEGKVSGDKMREAQGKAETLKGKVKEKIDDAKDAIEDKIDDIKHRDDKD